MGSKCSFDVYFALVEHNLVAEFKLLGHEWARYCALRDVGALHDRCERWSFEDAGFAVAILSMDSRKFAD